MSCRIPRFSICDVIGFPVNLIGWSIEFIFHRPRRGRALNAKEIAICQQVVAKWRAAGSRPWIEDGVYFSKTMEDGTWAKCTGGVVTLCRRPRAIVFSDVSVFEPAPQTAPAYDARPRSAPQVGRAIRITSGESLDLLPTSTRAVPEGARCVAPPGAPASLSAPELNLGQPIPGVKTPVRR